MANDAQDNHALRLRRSKSWSDQAKLFYDGEDPDTAFLFYWISFNALYAKQKSVDEDALERQLHREFISDIHQFDSSEKLYNFAWMEASQPIRNLLDNQFIYGPYWREVQENPEVSNWRDQLRHDEQKALRALKNKQTVTRLFCAVFDRLNVLRNQLAHGSATYQGSVNRQQVKTGAMFMHGLIPIFQNIFQSQPDHDWGEPPYPPQER